MVSEDLTKQEIVKEIANNPELRELLTAAEGSRPEHIQMAVDMLKNFKDNNPDN